MTIENLLSRLDKVRRRGNNQWMASCPCHQDKTPSLSIKDSDGTILIHCFSQQCTPHEICSSIGIEVTDLFPPSDNFDATQHKKHERSGFEPDMVLFSVVLEIMAVQLIAEEMTKAELLDSKIKERLDLAVSRIHGGWMYAKKYGKS